MRARIETGLPAGNPARRSRTASSTSASRGSISIRGAMEVIRGGTEAWCAHPVACATRARAGPAARYARTRSTRADMSPMGLTLTTGLTVVIGLGVLLAGRRLFWLFVAATGFLAGLRAGTHLLAGQPEWVMIAVAVALGLLGALLALFFQWLAIGLAGFVAGAYIGLVIAELLGVGSTGTAWVIAAAGGVIAAMLL